MPENKQCSCKDTPYKKNCNIWKNIIPSSEEEECPAGKKLHDEYMLDGHCSHCHKSAILEEEDKQGWENRIKEILLRNFDNDRYLWSKADLEFRELIYSFLQKNTQDVKKGFIEEMEKFEKEVKCPYNCFGRRCSHFETAIANIRILKNKLSSLLEKK